MAGGEDVVGWASGLFPYRVAPEAGSCFAALPEM